MTKHHLENVPIFWTSYTTQWPCVVSASNELSYYTHCIFCNVDFSIGGGNDVRQHVDSNKHKANRQCQKQIITIKMQYIVRTQVYFLHNKSQLKTLKMALRILKAMTLGAQL